ncbi:hypothetical protein H3N56_11045 [Cetobacterium sp. 2A]|uniref:hypothetical protein n=1 Tax=Cetobacterium sp. 2A TaxID=2754723 RepID=UPI00163BFCE8|nr:hypothetical protein [Cetobacterium sp. 2A]MBC2856969.1 hypothetical protein [Cetobacterium sp. 2A]
MNNNIIEMLTFKIKKEVTEEKILKLSKAFEEALKREVNGFIKRSLSKDCIGNKWIELIWWDSMESASIALDKIPKTCEFKEYCSILEDDESPLIYLKEVTSV